MSLNTHLNEVLQTWQVFTVLADVEDKADQLEYFVSVMICDIEAATHESIKWIFPILGAQVKDGVGQSGGG